MHARPRCPSKPEQTNRDEERANDCDGHTLLRSELAIGVILGLLHVIQVGEEWWHDNERANEKAEERQTNHLLPPMVDADEHNREGFEPDVQKRVDQADVGVESEHDRLLEVERERAHQDLNSKVTA